MHHKVATTRLLLFCLSENSASCPPGFSSPLQLRDFSVRLLTQALIFRGSQAPIFSRIVKSQKVILLEILAIPDILCYNNYGATEKRQAVSPLHFRRGASCSPVLKERGGYSMSTSEVLQLCLVIIGICGLFLQAYKKK